MKFTLFNQKKLYDGFLHLEMRTLQYETFSGTMSKKLDREVVIKNSAVAAVVYNKDTDKFLLVKQFRPAAADSTHPWIIELAAGHIDDGESAETAVVREIEEEIGYKPEKIHKLSSFYTSPGYSNEQIVLFSCTVDESMKTSSGGGLEIEDEDILIVEYSPQEVENMLQNNLFRDAKTIIGLNAYLSTLKME